MHNADYSQHQQQAPRRPAGRVRADGKFFTVGGERFPVRGVTYGTFGPRADGALYPDTSVLRRDLARMRAAGFNVVRTYTLPTPDLREAAAQCGLRLLTDAFYPDWRYLVGASRADARGVARTARQTVAEAARRLRGAEEVFALSLGTEIPADVLRWCGPERIARVLADLVDVAKDVDPELLVTYANYPTAEYLDLAAVDFLTFNVFLEERAAFRRYLTRLHHLAGDRPLVLGEVGLDAGRDAAGEQRQAQVLDWQLESALERGLAGACVFAWTDEWSVGGTPVTDWRFGLTRADRSPRPALSVAEAWNQRSVADLNFDWPSISVVVCAYNAAATLDECLRHTCALDYPRLEIIVVDDGSTDATAAIARRYPRARLIEVPHAGLSVARNAGMAAATGEIVAYLDSDAYPVPEWPWYLALGFDAPTVAGAGGPNLPPTDAPAGALQVARAPGGPVHVLTSDDRAEHIPGCNMAFWKDVLVRVGGFDPVYTAAGDDVDLCWRVLDAGWEIGFHPAAMVWHHRRSGLRPYLRQQRGYGRSESLVEARHPDRFTPVGTARWRGRIYGALPSLARPRVYHGVYGAAAYQSIYGGGGHGLDIAHQVGVPLAALLLALAPVAVVLPGYAAVVAAAVTGLLALGVVDAVRAAPPRRLPSGRLRFRIGVAAMHLLQPLVRTWSRTRSRTTARRDAPEPPALLGPVRRLQGNTLLVPQDRDRADLAAAVIAGMQRAGLRTVPATGWEQWDARVLASLFLRGELVTSAHPVGTVQIRVRRRPRWTPVAVAAGIVTAVGLLGQATDPTGLGGAIAVWLAFVGVDVARGWWRTGHFVETVVRRQVAQPAAAPRPAVEVGV